MIPKNGLCFFKDGDQWCCVFGDFINLQESQAGFGENPMIALGDLMVKEGEGQCALNMK